MDKRPSEFRNKSRKNAGGQFETPDYKPRDTGAKETVVPVTPASAKKPPLVLEDAFWGMAVKILDRALGMECYASCHINICSWLHILHISHSFSFFFFITV